MRFAFLFVLSFALIVTGSAFAQNILTNPGFETGDTTGWTACGGGMNPAFYNAPHEGSHAYGTAGCCGSWGSTVGAVQTAGSSGTDYDVFGWVKGCDNAVAQFGTGGTTCGAAPSNVMVTGQTPAGCDWVQGSGVVAGPVEVVFYAHPNGSWGTSAVHFDDASVVAQSAVEDWVLY